MQVPYRKRWPQVGWYLMAGFLGLIAIMVSLPPEGSPLYWVGWLAALGCVAVGAVVGELARIEHAIRQGNAPEPERGPSGRELVEWGVCQGCGVDVPRGELAKRGDRNLCRECRKKENPLDIPIMP